jgi:DNA-binding MarR family transcriptional regulator
VPRLDATRLLAWRELQSIVVAIHRDIDDDLRREWAVPLGSFEVLAALRDLGGRARPQDISSRMRIPPSSLSRRLDRLEEEGWIARHRDVDPLDHRAVDIELTARGRALWREMNVSFRRSVQARFAAWLSDDEIAVIGAVNRAVDPTVDADADPTVDVDAE